MALAERLDAIRAGAQKQIPADALKVMHAATDALRASGARDRVIGAGAPFPAFALPNQRGEVIRSEEVLARGPLILTVYRGIW